MSSNSWLIRALEWAEAQPITTRSQGGTDMSSDYLSERLASRLAGIQQRLKSVSSGPWRFEAFPHRVDIDGPDGGWMFRCGANAEFSEKMPDWRQSAADAKFIANARQDIPFLLAQVTFLQNEVSAARAEIDRTRVERDEARGVNS